jgi:ubiquinone biosynthesis protein
MHIQPSLVLLQKTMLNIEGLGRQLYPSLNLWDTAKPFLEDWVQERYSPQSFLRRLQRQAPSWLEQLPQLPDVMLDNLQQYRGPETEISQPQQVVAGEQSRLRDRARHRRRLLLAMVAGAGAVVTALPGGLSQLTEIPLVSWILAAAGLLLLWPREP